MFGDTDSVDAELDGEGGFVLAHARKGDTADKLLRLVDFDPDQLMASYRHKLAQVELMAGQHTLCIASLEAGLSGYTYLED